MNFIAWTTVAPPVAAGAAARAAGAAAPPPPPSEKAVGDWLTGGWAGDAPPWPSYDFLQLLSGKAIEMVPAREGTTSEEAPMERKENMASCFGDRRSGIDRVRRCVEGGKMSQQFRLDL